MSTQADSAYALLQLIKPELITTKRDKANYALLYSQALDKNYIDVTNDSLISIAVNYYSTNNNLYNRFLSYYYNGRIHYNAGKNSSALLFYTKAEQLIDDIDNAYAVGLLYNQLGLLYDECYDFHKSIEAYTKAADYFAKAQKEFHYNGAKYSEGRIRHKAKQFESAKEIFMQTLDWADKNNNQTIQQASIDSLISLYEELGQSEKIDSIISTPAFDNLSDNVFKNATLAKVAAAGKNKRQAAVLYLDKAWERAGNAEDTATMYYNQYLVYQKLQDYRKALENYKIVFHIQDTTLRSALQYPLMTVQRDYFHAEAENNALRLKNNRIILGAALSCAILIVLILVLIYRNRIKAKEEKFRQYFDLAQELKDSLYDKEQTLNKISGSVVKTIGELFYDKFKILDDLTNTYFQSNNTKKIKEDIYDHLKTTIEQFRSGDRELYGKLEDIVNHYMDNVMKKLRQGMPQLDEKDYQTACLFYVGLPAKTIQVLTNNQDKNFYMKKTRLKDRIFEAKPEGYKEMIRFLYKS